MDDHRNSDEDLSPSNHPHSQHTSDEGPDESRTEQSMLEAEAKDPAHAEHEVDRQSEAESDSGDDGHDNHDDHGDHGGIHAGHEQMFRRRFFSSQRFSRFRICRAFLHHKNRERPTNIRPAGKSQSMYRVVVLGCGGAELVSTPIFVQGKDPGVYAKKYHLDRMT